MKRVTAISLVLLLIRYSTVSEDKMERYFVGNVEVSGDMKKICSAILSHYEILVEKDLSIRNRVIKICCELFGKDNEKLDQEIEEIHKNFWDNSVSFGNERYEKLAKDLKGTRLDLSQIVALVKIIEPEYSKIKDKYDRELDKYRDRVAEIAKIIDKQEEESDKYYYQFASKDGLSVMSRFYIFEIFNQVLTVQDNRFGFYSECIYLISRLFKSEVFEDSFLARHESPILFEGDFGMQYYWFARFIPRSINKGENIFDAAKKAVSNQNMTKRELGDLIDKLFMYIEGFMSVVCSIQEDPVNFINWQSILDRRSEKHMEGHWENYEGYSMIRGDVIQLMDKDPKVSDFENDLDKLCERKAYKIYAEVVLARFIYQEWRKSYYNKIKNLLENTKILADRLCEKVQVEEIAPVGKRRDEQKRRLINIAEIREIYQIGVEKILPEVNKHISSQGKIKNALKKRYCKIRDSRLKILNQE